MLHLLSINKDNMELRSDTNVKMSIKLNNNVKETKDFKVHKLFYAKYINDAKNSIK